MSSLLNGAASWVPTPWGDEAATLSAASRPLPDLLQLVLHRIDAVHAVYYLIVHAFVAVGGPSVLVLRLPSVIAVGVATAGIAVLGRRLVDTRLGVIAGVVSILLPQLSWAATEARSAALVMAVSAWLLVAFAALTTSRRRRRDAAFVVIATVAVAVNVYAVLTLGSLVVAAMLVAPWRRLVLRVIADCAIAIALASPVVLLSLGQASQVSWLPGFDAGTVRQVVEHQWFEDAAGFAVAAWALMLLATVLLVRGRVLRADWSEWDRAATLAVVVAILPTALLLGATIAGRHAYLPRYTAISLPAVALLIGIGVKAIGSRWRWTAPALIALLAVLAAPDFVALRQVDAKGNEWAETVADAEARAPAGQPVYVQDTGNLVAIRVLFPHLFDGHPDVGRGAGRVAADDLWDHPASPVVAARRSSAYASVTVVARTAEWASSRDLAAFEARGFEPVGTQRYGETEVVELRR